MSTVDILQRHGSDGNVIITPRTDFHVYLWPYDGSANVQLDATGFAYYRALGFNFCRDHYQVAGGSAFSEANIRSQVDTFWTNPALNPPLINGDIDLWFVDNESSYYAGTVADAANSLAGAQNAVSWSKSQWATHSATTMYVGCYGNNTGIQRNSINEPYQYALSVYETFRDDNDACGIDVANTWDWMGPELYQNKNIEFALGMDWLCSEKVRMGIDSRKLIPLISRNGTFNTYDGIYSRLVYAFYKSECNGIALWGTAVADAGPTYYDNYPWMQAALDFCEEYGITAGTPF